MHSDDEMNLLWPLVFEHCWNIYLLFHHTDVYEFTLNPLEPGVINKDQELEIQLITEVFTEENILQ